MRLLIAAAVVAALASQASARVYTGTINGDDQAVLAHFAFGKDPSGPVGYMSMVYGTAQNGVQLAMYDDDAWDGLQGAPCAAALPLATNTVPLPQIATVAYQTFFESTRPHMWFFTVANAPSCSSPVLGLSYTLTLTQTDGGQLSYDEMGLPGIYGAFWTLLVVGQLVYAYAAFIRPRKPDGRLAPFRPLIVLMLVSGIMLELVSVFCHLIDYARAASDGIGAPALGLIGGLLRICSHMAGWMMASLVAVGYGITSYALFSKANIVPLVFQGFLLIWYIALVAWYATVGRSTSNLRMIGTSENSWPGILLLITTLLYLGWFVWRVRKTIQAEANTLKRKVLLHLAIACGLLFALLPLIDIVAAAVPAYERLRVTTGLDLFCVCSIYAFTCWVLWPARAREAFHVTDSSKAVFLDYSQLDDGAAGGLMEGAQGGGMAGQGMDAAYASAGHQDSEALPMLGGGAAAGGYMAPSAGGSEPNFASDGVY